ncbi:hypothetical protein [uncultured Shewanella sp.]|uniref:hypothetical protein n=1 Tax=uncultured Shewanella sp. TaxID=173975 RepID=UPI002629AA90|nr:hypothetical protein [uncultured Shewanella sp.]
MKLIRAIWYKYIQWCDSMGLTPENRRSCAPRLTDPEFQSAPKLKCESAPRDRESVIEASTGKTDSKLHHSQSIRE